MQERAVIPSLDADSIYAVPLTLEEEGLCREVLDVLDLQDHDSDMAAWAQLVHNLRNPGPAVKIALVGKYVQLNDAYLSVVEALRHACIAQDASLDLHWVPSRSNPMAPTGCCGDGCRRRARRLRQPRRRWKNRRDPLGPEQRVPSWALPRHADGDRMGRIWRD